MFHLWFYLTCLICISCTPSLPIRPIRVALSVDDHSFKDIIILMNSVIESAIDPTNLVFHIVACGKDLISGNVLKKLIVESMDSCFPHVKKEVVAFSLPETSGFAIQLANSKKNSHWNSKIGADMVRFFLASLFPTVDRLLYLDNDIIVSCCLEEIFDTDLDNNVVGIALDDLAWATMTQFKYHYNASHPLVIKNMRRNQSAINQFIHNANEPISKEEFHKKLPRYPNDGVLLIDVKKFNEQHILESLEEIAHGNGRGEYVVNLGTQQFTVLTLFDRWKELTPRANLRHFPDMARGYLMWFYYNGFLHYAGQAKPRTLCENGNYKDNWLRVQSYTAWANSNAQVATKCGHDHLVYAPSCVPHIPVVRTMYSVYQLLSRIIEISRDETLEYIRVGPLHGDLSVIKHSQDYTIIEIHNQTHSSISSTSSSSSSDSKRDNPSLDFIEIFDRMALHNASWSFRDYDCPDYISCNTLLNTAVDTVYVNPKTVAAAQGDLAKAAAKSKKKGVTIELPVIPANQLRFDGKRSFIVYKKQLCTALPPNSTAINTPTPTVEGSVPNSCTSLVEDVRLQGKKHWDVLGIVIDTTPPQYLLSDSGTNDASKSVHSSLSILLGLDLIFMRPKFIILRLSSSTQASLQVDVDTTKKYLSRSGSWYR